MTEITRHLTHTLHVMPGSVLDHSCHLSHNCACFCSSVRACDGSDMTAHLYLPRRHVLEAHECTIRGTMGIQQMMAQKSPQAISTISQQCTSRQLNKIPITIPKTARSINLGTSLHNHHADRCSKLPFRRRKWQFTSRRGYGHQKCRTSACG